MSLSDDDIKFALRFYNHEVTSKEFADYLVTRNIKFKDVESELRNYGFISEIQKSKVDSVQEFTAFLLMGEVVSIGDDSHFFTEDGVIKLYQSSNGSLYTLNDTSRIDKIFDFAVSQSQEISVRFGTRIYFDKNPKTKRSVKNEKNSENDNGKH